MNLIARQLSPESETMNKSSVEGAKPLSPTWHDSESLDLADEKEVSEDMVEIVPTTLLRQLTTGATRDDLRSSSPPCCTSLHSDSVSLCTSSQELYSSAPEDESPSKAVRDDADALSDSELYPLQSLSKSESYSYKPLRTRRNESSRSPVPLRTNNQARSPLSTGEPSFGSTSERCPFRDDGSSSYFSRRRGRKREDILSVSERMMASSDHDSKIRSVIAELSINKLQYDKVGLVGREKETKMMKDCYARLTRKEGSHKPEKEMVLVKGYSGVGKSSLVSPLLEMCDQSATGFCARGKFDFSSVDGPYTAITSAFGQIFETVERRGSLSVSTYHEFGQMQTLGEALASQLGNDVHLLARMIPKLKRMIPETVPPPSLSESLRKRDSTASQKRWEYSLRVLTRELNKMFNPLVLFLDDIHWADVSSLNLIDCLLSDVENDNAFMVVGCYRSNAVEESHILPEKLKHMEEKKSKYGFNLSEVEIGNLDKEGVQDVIMTLLSMDDKKKTKALADICFRRTLGNPFFLMEFMAMLNEESLLEYNLGLLGWTWDDEEVEHETMSTENVVDLVHSRMTRLSASAQLVLQYAACLGTTIKVECLSVLMANSTVDEDATITSLLHQLEKGGFIEHTRSTQFRWVHDNVRESALMLGNASTPFFQFDVGNTLFHHFDDEELDEILFEVCDLINEGRHSRRVEFAKLNCRAAEKARSISAFPSAAIYAAKGISYLPNEKWTQEYDITLRLYTLAMEMGLATGQVEEMEEYAAEILQQPNCSPIDKLPVYLAVCHKMTYMYIDHEFCTKFLLRVLDDEHGIRLFGNKKTLPMKAGASIYMASKNVKKLPKGTLSQLQPMDRSNSKYAAMDLLVRLSTVSYLGKNISLYLLTTAKMTELTLKNGVHPMSGYAFLSLGMCNMALNGDAAEGASFDKIAKQLHETVPDDFASANTTTISNLFVQPWIMPLNSCLQELKASYSISMRAGNTEMGMLSFVECNIILPLQMGKPLSSIESKCATVAAQCEELKFGQYSVTVRLHWNLILELMGQPDESVFVNNEVLQAEGWYPEEYWVEYIELHKHVYTGDYDAARELAFQMGDGYEKSYPNNHQIMSCTFLKAIALYASAARSNKSKRQANKLRQKMKTWIKRGNPNVVHCHHLLCAENARLDGKFDKASALYNDAIVLAARTGHIHHAALANERYADFLLRCMKDKEEWNYRMNEAIRFYQDWGAEKRVQQLQQPTKQ